jgi:hypothetical protein
VYVVIASCAIMTVVECERFVNSARDRIKHVDTQDSCCRYACCCTSNANDSNSYDTVTCGRSDVTSARQRAQARSGATAHGQAICSHAQCRRRCCCQPAVLGG